MAIQYIRTKTHDVLPAIHDGHAWRALGRIKTDTPKMAVAPLADFLANQGIPLIDPTKIAPYDRYQSDVPILDQQQVGSCVAHAHATAVMKARDIVGQTFQALSPDSLYAWIDRNVDQGSDPSDAITALEQTGICLLSDVPDNFILLSSISDAAKQTALRFRISQTGVYAITSFAELVTADYLGFATTITINVGGNFNNLNNDGVVPFAGGVANHCVSGGEAFKLGSGNTPMYRFRNSWATTWPGTSGGTPGCAWITSQHIDRQSQGEYFAIMFPMDDPDDPNNTIPSLDATVREMKKRSDELLDMS